MMAARFDPGAMRLEGNPIAVPEAGFWSISDGGKLFFTNSRAFGGGTPGELVWLTRAAEPARRLATQETSRPRPSRRCRPSSRAAVGVGGAGGGMGLALQWGGSRARHA